MFLDFETLYKEKVSEKEWFVKRKAIHCAGISTQSSWLFDVLAFPYLFPPLFIHHFWFLLDALFPSHSTLIFAIPVGSLHVSADNTLSSCNYFANLYPIPSSAHRHRPFIPHSRILNPFSLFSTITQASIKYTFVGGPRTVTVAGYLFFQ